MAYAFNIFTGTLDNTGPDGVKSLEGLKGDVTFNVGAGIVLTTTSPDTINISSPGPGVTFPLIAPGSNDPAAPDFAFSETGFDTGMYSTGDGNISWSTNAQAVMSLDSPGDLHVVGNITAANFPIVGNANTFAGFDGSGAIESIPGFQIDTTSGGENEFLTQHPNDESGGFSVNTTGIDFQPLQASPDVDWNINNIYVNMDSASSGFVQGTSGEAVTVNNLNIQHHGTGDTGNLNLTKNYFDIGNGTDPITVGGLAYSLGFGNINDNVAISNQVQGYGFQINASAASTVHSFNGFYDFSNIQTDTDSYSSYAASPTITNVRTNHNYVGLETSPHIATLTGNATAFGLTVGHMIGSIDTQGSFQGVNVNPTITTNKNYVAGINVNMNNVTNDPGAQATLVVQDITYTRDQAGTDGNTISIEYTDTTTAGNEVATLVGNAITVSIQSGVSIATQVVAALNANSTIATNLVYPITGVGSNPQVTYGPTNLAGGINPGRKLAGDFNGDVNINGSLAFTGGLSIGALTSFAPKDLTTLTSGVNSIDGLITAPSVGANTTVSGSDLLGVNTAMLLSIGDNSTVTSNFLGYAALGLPAVVSMGSGSSIDRVEGAVFALSLDSGATGGSIDEINLCRALTLPNGVTTVTKLKAYDFDLPFGDPGTTTWGVYMAPNVHNFMAGNLKIGGTDTVVNDSVALEIESTTKALLNARMSETQRDALTAVNGMQLYNTTTDKLQVYAAGIWVDLH